MKELTRPPMLKEGDTVATVSLSWGGAGDADLLWRYELGKKRLETQFGLHVIEMEHTLKGSEFLYNHPEKRAEDLMQAFRDPSVKAVISCIGGCESVRMLPFIDFDVISRNPKIFMGYSDSTITHLICFKAGVSSLYGPSLLAELAENVQIFDYTAGWLQKALFSGDAIGAIPAAEQWTGERLEWTLENAQTAKKMQRNRGYEFLQGTSTVRGRLFGGCIEVLEMAKGTALWPAPEAFEDAILFFETSEDMPDPTYFEYWLRNYGSQGILQKAAALLFGKPYQERYYNEYQNAIRKVTRELGRPDLPVVCNMSFGHNEPMFILPYGALAEVDCGSRTVSILEPGVCGR